MDVSSKIDRTRFAVPGALMLLLAACHGAAPEPGAPAPAQSFAAVARGRVDVEGGLVSVAAPREGIVGRVAIREGDTVHRGDVLVELDDRAAKLAVAVAEAELAQARAAQQSLERELAALRTRAARLTEGVRSGATEGQLADDAEAQVAQTEAQAQAARAAVTAAQARVDAARQEASLRQVRAPVDGEVLRVDAQPGAFVAPGAAALAELLPQRPHLVRAEINESLADRVVADMPATVSAESDPTRSWRAHVRSLGKVVAPSRLEEDPQRRLAERSVEGIVVLDEDSPLRIGQRVLVHIGPQATQPP
jgi:multidrug efflux pump subunit AcrA (membrane-fusion protein)